MAKFETREITEYRLQCQATWDDDGSGCCCGPAGHSETEAIEFAQRDGWLKIQGRWACPAHVRGRENAEAAEDQSQH